MMHRDRMDHRAAGLSVHAAGAGGVGDGGGGLRGAVLLPRAQGLVADGRRHFACRAAGHRARPCAEPAAGARRFRGRPFLRAADRLPQGEQPREGGHGDGDRVLGHVRAGAGHLHQGRYRPASDAHPVRQCAGRDRAGPDRNRHRRRRHAAGRSGQAARSAALLLRSQPRPFDRPAGAGHALWPAGAAVAHHRRLAEGGRHHSRHCHADCAGRHGLSPDRQFRADAGDRGRHRHRVGGARDHRQLPHRRGDRRLHRADPGLVLHPGIPVCAEARHLLRTRYVSDAPVADTDI